jgi:ATP-dependent Lon protease
MSGEITLRGHVLAVGGIKEKLLAARRAKVESVLLPRLNRKEVDDLPAGLLSDLGVVFVEEVREALDRALV